MAATLLLLLATAAAGARLGELARRDTGDIFTIIDDECSPAQCAEHGAGAGAGVSAAGECACACPQRAPLFREDRELCVDDLPECSLATFGTGSAVQRIPFVYLPLKGQIIHPSREITFQNVKTPICAVSGAQFLTRKGFLDLRNTLDADVPFNLFRDEGRTFLQWSGEDEVRARMTGRVMVVRLLCRDVAATPTSPLDLRGVFTPCVAFRVQGTPPKPYSIQFAPNAQTSESSHASGLTVSEYVAIGISSLLLGLVYVASVFLFLHMRKRRKATSDEDGRRLKGLKKKDGSIITERDIVRVNNERMQNLPSSMGQDDGIIKKNPLLSIGSRQLHDVKHYPNDSSSNLSDLDDFADSSAQSDDNLYTSQTISAVVHHNHGDYKMKSENSEISHRDESGIERLPHEHVSIVETTDDREIARPVGTTRRKLYFNPAYFEPQLMAEPPAAALEFLVKIREVISIAKHKMAAKRFQPILNQIPEEETFPSNGNSIDLYQGMGSQRSGSVVSLKRENSRKKNCVGCPGCKIDNNNDLHHITKYNIPACANCLHNKGDKQSSIRKWLENLPTLKQHALYNDLLPANQNVAESLLSLPSSESRRKIRKQNSFSSSNSMYLTDNFSVPKKSSTLSVRSEPMTRNYNLPLPDFENLDRPHNDFNFYCQTVARVEDIRPIGFNEFRIASLQNNPDKRLIQTFANKNALPDMVNEAIALDHCTKSYNQASSDEEKNSGKSPEAVNQSIFSRNASESPSGNDYETDSLERNSNKKGLSTPTDYPDVPSSQASPSLSNALPLEEELTMRNAVYKIHSSSNSNTPSPHRDVHVNQNLYETINNNKVPTFETPKPSSPNKDYSLVTEVYVNNNYNFESAPTSPSGSECSMGSRKLLTGINEIEEKPGCLTIEVKDSPENYIKIHESDGFEPDTLDRKHPKHQIKDVVDKTQFSRKDFIKNIEGSSESPSSPQRIQLRSSGTFTKTNEEVEYTSKFNSLRNEYEQGKLTNDRPKLSTGVYSGSKSLEETVDEDWQEAEDWVTEEGRILTLELRHSKRQRQCTPPTIKQLKNLARPDVLPPLPPSDDDPIYEQPIYPPRRVDTEKLPSNELTPKNLSGRSLSPRSYIKNTTSESTLHDSSTSDLNYGPSCSPMRASVQSQSSEYENMESVSSIVRKPGDLCRNVSRKRSDRIANINTDTFVKATKGDGHPKSRFRRKKGSNVQDSGYLSSDSTSSRQVQRKLVIAKIVSCSESDDTENEARSESGAESIETHSVYFDSFRKLQANIETYSFNSSSRDSSGKFKHSDL
ncbi:shavenoid isoform X2 [Anticarsia gemmatalis]|uniref:shavenoid isoform X2 n=1 Tax=Anticarsia gemmatalis TaxID=129554 RepID=UPI003F76CB56